MADEDHRFRLGRQIRARRKELRLTQAQVQNLGGPSTATLRLIENGKAQDFRRSTTDILETILGWETGTISAILWGQIDAPPADLADVEAFHQATGGAYRTDPGPVVSINGFKVPQPPSRSDVASQSERLRAAQNKMRHGVPLTPEDQRALSALIENEQLATIHVRLDALPRAEQLIISDHIDTLSETHFTEQEKINEQVQEQGPEARSAVDGGTGGGTGAPMTAGDEPGKVIRRRFGPVEGDSDPVVLAADSSPNMGAKMRDELDRLAEHPDDEGPEGGA